MVHYVTLSGGIGDAIMAAHDPTQPFGKLRAFKRRYPHHLTRVIIASTGNAAPDLFRLDPSIDEIVHYPLDGSWSRYVEQAKYGHKPLADVPNLDWQAPNLYLSDQEQDQVAKLKPLEPFLSFHPFAGGSDRDLVQQLSRERFRRVLDVITSTMPVVITGATHNRTLPEGAMHLVETLDDTRCINLVNQPVRVQAAIAKDASRFLGSISSWHCWATCHQIPAMLFAPIHLTSHIHDDPKPGIFSQLKKQGQRVVWFEDIPVDLDRQLREFLRVT